VEVVASLSQGRTAAAQCGLFTYKSVPVIFEPPCVIRMRQDARSSECQKSKHYLRVTICGAPHSCTYEDREILQTVLQEAAFRVQTTVNMFILAPSIQGVISLPTGFKCLSHKRKDNG